MAATVGSIIFVVVVVGGMGSLAGAFVASLLIGVLADLRAWRSTSRSPSCLRDLGIDDHARHLRLSRC